jgi:ABC-type Fe3+ transport system substrate-binding protein
MVALKETLTPLKLKMLKLSKLAWITVAVIAIFAVSIAATSYYYYIIEPTRLRILYTQSDPIVNKVVNGFKEWYGRPIEVTLTPTDPQSAYETVTNPYRKPEAEIWWGGSLPLFEKASNSLLPYNSTNKNEINTTVHSCPLMDLDHNTPHWYAASLYALGVMYNEHVLEALSLTKPQTWADLLRAEYEENVTMVDPTESEFTQPFIMLAIQSQNWTEGWQYLVRLSAFVKHYDATETNSVLKVASGYLSVAIVPDFYAYDKIQELERVGIHSVNFTYLDATILQPDPIAIIKRGKYIDEAKAFIDYVLTQQAQSILGKYRLPIRQDAAVNPPRINPFAPNFPHVPDYNRTFEEIVKDYYRAWITERHEEEPSIKTAWKEIKEANETSPYYSLAWNNFTRAGHYINYTEISAIYNATDGWTKNVNSYMNDWRTASRDAYNHAIENAKESKK